MALITREKRKATASIREKQDGTKRYRFPMPDAAHARNALARLNQAKGLSSDEREKIVQRAFRILGWPDKEHPESVSDWLKAHAR